MIITAKDLAKYFRESVSFDFEKEAILSYSQIRRRYDDFYALENERAFIALLHDVVGNDDQLVDVFSDLRRVDRGLKYFAEEKNRSNAFLAVAYFLSDSRYSYHKADIARVYLAINTWLCFFGAPELSASFDECPICASPVKDGVCTNSKCKKKDTDFILILCELQELLTKEQNGTRVSLPKYYKLIAPNAQFAPYKEKIDAIRDARDSEKKEQETNKKKEAINEAEKELERLFERIKLELAKEKPDLDSILQELNDNPKIAIALGYDDSAFDKKVDALREEIANAKNTLLSKKETENQKKLAMADFKEFSILKGKLDAELANKGIELPMEKVREMLDSAEEVYQRVSSANSRFPGVFSESERKLISDYETLTRPNTEKRLKERVEEELLDDAKDNLVIIIGEIEKELIKCENLKDGASELWERFINEVEKNETFIDCRERPSWDAIYIEITAPIKGKLSDLVTEETKQKKKAFKDKLDPLKASVSAAKPRDKVAYDLKAELDAITSNKYFDSIKSSAEYKKEISALEKAIDTLIEKQEKYFRTKRRAISITTSFVVILAVFLYSLFAYILPMSKIGFEATEQSTDRYAVTGLKDTETEILVIDEYLPHYFLQKNKRVAVISADAFNGSTYLKKCILPATIEEIGDGAFANCEALSTVVLMSNEPPSVGTTTFDSKGTIILVPEESYTAYLQHKDWKQYRTRIFPNYGNEDGYGTVMFDSNGGSAVEPLKTIQLSASVGALPTPVRPGFGFAGWYYIDNTGKEVYVDSENAVFSASTKLMAKWKIGEYTVSFDLADGSSEPIKQTYSNGASWTNLPSVSRKGYTFEGWYLNNNMLASGAVVSLTSDVTVYAKWTPNTYEITFDYAGGVQDKTTGTVTFDTAYGSLPTTERRGYTFAGWSVDGKLIDKDSIAQIAASHTLVAKWTPIKYTIRYNTSGGEVASTVVGCEYDKTITISTPTRTGYTFTHWEHNGTIYNAGDEVINLASTSVELVLVAKWTPNSYKIKYDTDGGSIEKDEQDCVYDVDVTLGTPAKTGYSFLYWSYEGKKYSASEITSNITPVANGTAVLKAIWKPNTYTIKYDLAGGSATSTLTECAYGASVVLETPTRQGYTFSHWQWGTQEFSAGQTVSSLTSENGGIINLVAVWTANGNIISFNSNLGTGEMSDITIKTAESGTLPLNTFTRAGYTFIGWSTSANGEAIYTDGATYQMGSEPRTTLYAVWQANLNTLVIYANNGTEQTKELKLYTGQVINLPLNDFTYAGYTFEGWATEGSGGVAYEDGASFIMPAAATTYIGAIWKANQNTLVLDANNGTGSTTKQYISTNSAMPINACTFTKQGYKFVGWSSTRNGGVEYLDGSNYLMGTGAEYTLYAVWEIVNYQISYELDGGTNSSANPNSYNINTEVIMLASPVKAGYTFDGWYSDEAGTRKITEINTASTGNITIYAKWTVNKNKINFSSASGEGSMSSIEAETGSVITLPECTFTKTGYKFVGWSTENGADVSYFALSSYEVGTNSEYTLYAVWEKEIYTITYNTNGGANSSANPDTYHIESSEITLASPSREGYTFAGWYAEATMTTASIDKIPAQSIGNKVLYAKWEAKQNTIVFNSNGGTGTMSSITLATGQQISALPLSTFEKTGYNFAGWSLTPNGSSIYANGASFEMGTESTVTLYAVWTNLAYTVSYNLDGGTNNQQNPSGFAVDSGDIVLQAPTKAGYTFIGWYTDAQKTNKITVIKSGSTASLVLYAKWQINTNTIVFNANGGSGTMTNQYANTMQGVTLKANTFTRVGYTFAGWATSANGSVVYKDKAEYIMGTGSSYTLYAKWTPNTYTITYGSYSKTVTYGQPYGSLSNPSAKTGHSFTGWYYGATKITASSIVNVAANHTLKAEYTPNTYTVTYGSKTKSVVYGQTYGDLGLPTAKTGYTPTGWSYGGSTITSSTKMLVASNHTLTGTYSVNSYTVTMSLSNTNVTVKLSNGTTYTNQSFTVPYGTSMVVSFGSTFSSVASLSCSFDGTAISNGDTVKMPAYNVTLSASSTEDTGSCLAKGTQILLANGKTASIESLRVGDKILSFDHKTGKLVETEIVFTFFAFNKTSVIDLHFSDGSTITVINDGHGIYNATKGGYVLLGPNSVDGYVGDSFVITKQENGSTVNSTVTLDSYEIYEEYRERYDIATLNNLNFIANGFITCSDVLVNACNVFEFTSELTYDSEQMQADIEKYGVYTYEEWSSYLTYEEFVSLGAPYFKVAVGKGLITIEEIYILLDFLNSWDS